MRRLFSNVSPVFWITCCLVAGLIASAPLAATGYGASLNAANDAVLGDKSSAVNSKTYTVGHLTLNLTGGYAIPVLSQPSEDSGLEAKPIGVLFVGGGSFSYTPDPHESVVFQKNLKRSTKFSMGDQGLTHPVTSVILWGPQHHAQFMNASSEDATSEVQDSDRKLWQKAQEETSNAFASDIESLATFAMLEGHSDSSWMDIREGGNHLRHYYDPSHTRREALTIVKEIDTTVRWLKDRLYEVQLSEQPINRSWLEPVPSQARLVDVDVQLIQTDEKNGALTVKQSYMFDKDTSIMALSFRTLHTEDLIEHEAKIDSVKVDGADASFVTTSGDLFIDLPTKKPAGSTATLEFEISGNFLIQPGGDSYWWLGTSAWLPLPQFLSGQFFSYHAIVKVKPPYIAFSNGPTVRRWEEEGYNCAEFKEDNPILLPVILAGKYTIYEREEGDLKLVLASYAGKKTQRMKQMSENVLALLEKYKMLLGDYPYKELKILEINSYGFGQAPPGIIFMTSEAFDPSVRGWSEGVNSRLAHEIAHTWWGDTVPWASPQDQWLSESLAEYYAAAVLGLVWRQSEFDKKIREWRQSAREVQGDSIMLSNLYSDTDGFRDRQALLYNKGPLVLHALRQRIGDQAFFTTFRSLATNFKYKFASTDDAIRMLEFVTKKDHRNWMIENLLGTGWPVELEKKGKKK